MLRFERAVVGALVTTPDQPVRSSVEAFVDGSLRDMPEAIRAGVVAESLLFAAYTTLRGGGRGGRDAEALRHHLDAWERSPVGLIRQYPRLMRSLVLFAENELTAGSTA
jgi:hypothetical protein